MYDMTQFFEDLVNFMKICYILCYNEAIIKSS